MAREVDDGEILVRLLRVERATAAIHYTLLTILSRLERAHVGDPPEVLAPFMRTDDGN